MKIYLLVLFSAVLLLGATPRISTASTSQNEKIDYVALGSTLVRDGYIQRAKSVLEKVDLRKAQFDYATYYTLKGIVYQKMGYPAISNIFFDAAINKGQTKRSIYLYMARNYWSRLAYRRVIDSLDKAGQVALDNPQMLVIKAEAYKQIGEMEQAWAVLDQGISLHPDFSKFYSQKFYYLLELGFYQTAQEYAHTYLESEHYSAKDYLSISYAYRESKRYDDAARLLEEGALKYPQDDKIIELLGQVYIDQGKYLSAAMVFDWASIRYPKFAAKAATLYLKSNEAARSLQLNRRIIDQTEKFRQRIGIDIHFEDYESMVAKIETLKRYNLLSDENILYALGFAYFKNGDFKNAKNLLQRVTDRQLFTKASYLFQQIENCQNDPFACR